MTEPITDEELANLRVWLGRFPDTSATTTVQLKSLIARIDLERNRADEAVRAMEANIVTLELCGEELNAAEREIADLKKRKYWRSKNGVVK